MVWGLSFRGPEVVEMDTLEAASPRVGKHTMFPRISYETICAPKVSQGCLSPFIEKRLNGKGSPSFEFSLTCLVFPVENTRLETSLETGALCFCTSAFFHSGALEWFWQLSFPGSCLRGIGPSRQAVGGRRAFAPFACAAFGAAVCAGPGRHSGHWLHQLQKAVAAWRWQSSRLGAGDTSLVACGRGGSPGEVEELLGGAGEGRL